MKIKLIDELENKRDVSIEDVTKSTEALSNEARQLLLNAGTEERQILREAGLDTNIQSLEAERGINIERATFEGTYGQKVFTNEEVKNVCHKYALKMLNTRHYKGAIDPVLGARIVAFFKKSKIDSKSYEAGENLFIMAPVTAFTLKRKTDPLSIKMDPILFYRISRRNEPAMWVPIHQWGNDFTIFRRIVGAVKYNFWTNALFGTACKSVLFLTAMAICKLNPTDVGPIVWSVILGFVAHFIQYMVMYGGSEGSPITGSEHKFSQKGWNQALK